ncbi:hypothetical protein ACOMHN_061958 [Nucella lapillus]
MARNLKAVDGCALKQDLTTSLSSMTSSTLTAATLDSVMTSVLDNHAPATRRNMSASSSSNTNTNNNNNHDDGRLPGCPRIITRSEWGARAPNHAIADMSDLPVYAFIHPGASSSCENEEMCKQKVRAYQDYHMDGHGWWDIGYNFLVGEDGNAYEARGWNEQGAHTKGYNSNGIAIYFIGNFTERLPSVMTRRVALNLIQCGLANLKIQANYTLKGHRDVGSTLCPADQLHDCIHGGPHFVVCSLFVPRRVRLLPLSMRQLQRHRGEEDTKIMETAHCPNDFTFSPLSK